MARLADLIWTWQQKAPFWLRRDHPAATAVRQDWERLKSDLASAVVIVADNVCEYLYAGTEQEVWEYTRDFPCCAPPFETFFVEMKRPSAMVSQAPHPRGLGIQSMCRFWGWLFRASSRRALAEQTGQLTLPAIRRMTELSRDALRGCIDVEAIRAAMASANPRQAVDRLDPAERQYVECCATIAQIDKGAFDASMVERLRGEWLSGPVEWNLDATLVVGDNGSVMGPMCNLVVSVGRDGRIVFNPSSQIWAADGLGTALNDANHTFRSMCLPALLALSFLNCKNVRIEDHEPRPLTAKEQRAGQRPWVRFKTLDITPMKRVLATEGRAESEGLKRALHICRGHFATYSEERPLFGKYAGQFWIPAHVRGTAGQGIISNRYDVSPPCGGEGAV